MKNRFFAGCMLAAGIFICQSAAYANPYVFEFTENYDYSSNVTIFGTAANIAVTVDNGNASSTSQVYTWNDIIGVSVQAVGGTFSDTWTNIYRTTDTSPFLTTDASGLFGTVSFGPGGPDEYVNGSSTFTPNSYNQLGSGSWTTLALTFYGATDNAFINHDIQTIATLTPVPEPETYAMMIAGLGLLSIAARRRKQQPVA